MQTQIRISVQKELLNMNHKLDLSTVFGADRSRRTVGRSYACTTIYYVLYLRLPFIDTWILKIEPFGVLAIIYSEYNRAKGPVIYTLMKRANYSHPCRPPPSLPFTRLSILRLFFNHRSYSMACMNGGGVGKGGHSWHSLMSATHPLALLIHVSPENYGGRGKEGVGRWKISTKAAAGCSTKDTLHWL